MLQPIASGQVRRNAWIADVWGGLAAMLVALPSAIGFGVAVYGVLGPSFVPDGVLAGIVGASILGVVASACGGAPRLISAPCAPAAAVLAAFALELTNPAPGSRPLAPAAVAALLAVVGLLSALFQLLYGLLRGGRIIKFIPYPVVSGYLSAVGVLILASQLPKFLGVPAAGATSHAVLDPTSWSPVSLTVGIATLLGLFVARRWFPGTPSTIIALLTGLIGYWGIAFLVPECRRLADNPWVLGPLGAGIGSMGSWLGDRWQSIRTLEASDLRLVLYPALTLSVLLSIDTLKTCVIVDAVTRTRHHSNRTLISQGLGNALSALCGGMPGAGTMGATLVSINSGGTTRLSGMLEGAFVAIAFLVLGGLIAWMPIAALAAILMAVGARMIDWDSFRLLRSRATLLDFGVIAAVVLVAIRFSLIAAAGAGLALSVLLFVREQMRSPVIHRKAYGHNISSRTTRQPEEREVLKREGIATVVCELQGSLFFGTTDQLFSELEADLKRCRYLILDLRRVRALDFTAAHMLKQIQEMLGERDARLLFASVPASLPSGQPLQQYLRQLGVTDQAQNVLVFDELDAALSWVEDRLLTEKAGGANIAPSRCLELREFDLLREFEADHTLAALQRCVEECQVAAGETIFRQGDPGDELFLIRSGVVRIELPIDGQQRHCLASFTCGHFFGEMSFLDRGNRSADAVAVQATSLYRLSRRRLDDLIRAEPVVGIKLFARLARVLALRLRHTDAELRSLYET